MSPETSHALPGAYGSAVAGAGAALRVELGDGLAAEVLCGEREIARHAGRIDEFISGCVDADAWGGTTLWLKDAVAQCHLPCAVLLQRGHAPAAVALGLELTLRGRRTRLAMCGNETGQRGFFTRDGIGHPASERMLRAAGDAMMAAGVAALLVSLKVAPEDPPEARDKRSSKARSSKAHSSGARSGVATRARRTVYDTFKLGASFHESLSRLGAHTRRNLRYYRRRAERELQCEFLPRMEGSLLRHAVLELQCCTDDPVAPAVAKNNIAQVTRNGQAFCMGLRGGDGRWLSWVSGWRAGRRTYIDRQCNRSGMARSSLSTVMRSYLIEHETLTGQRHIGFLGGTPHSMRFGFREEVCVDWLLTRRGPWAPLLRTSSPLLRALRWFTRRRDARARKRGGAMACRCHPVLHLLKRMGEVVIKNRP